MCEFELGEYRDSNVLRVYSDRDEIELEPDYQRISEIWNREKRQLLIDSLLNGFDIPKFYFHKFKPPRKKENRTYRYAIVDGKQRLQAIWDFIDGKLKIDDDFEYLSDENVKVGGLTYNELANKYPKLKLKFDSKNLDIVTIETDDVQLIEDLFSRLNEAVPLNAPEKRNAFGGPLPTVITETAGNKFFGDRIPFADQRYRHRDLAAKFLYIEHTDKIVNTKKVDLDNFVRDFKRKYRGEAGKRRTTKTSEAVRQGTESTLALMSKIFRTRDPLLRQVGMITLYYHLFRLIRKEKVGQVTRHMLDVFEKERVANKKLAENDDKPNAGLLEFDTHAQTPNDAYALKIRLDILLRFLNKDFKVRYDQRAV